MSWRVIGDLRDRTRGSSTSWRECEGVEPSADGEGSLPADLKSVKPTGTHPLPRSSHLHGGCSNTNVSATPNGPQPGIYAIAESIFSCSTFFGTAPTTCPTGLPPLKISIVGMLRMP